MSKLSDFILYILTHEGRKIGYAEIQQELGIGIRTCNRYAHRIIDSEYYYGSGIVVDLGSAGAGNSASIIYRGRK